MPANDTGKTVTLEVFRYLPETETQPRFQSYTVPFREDRVVLDALNHIKDHIDGTLSFRWSCRMGVCGSCGMMEAAQTRPGAAALERGDPMRPAALTLSLLIAASPAVAQEGLKVGDPAPGFSLPGSDGKTHTLEEHKGKQAVVIAWFPKAFTGG